MLEQILWQLALGQPDADKPDWMVACDQLGSNLTMVPPPAVLSLSRVDHSQVNLSFEDISSGSVACSLSMVDKENKNLSAPKKELLEEH
jgi:hypothetical protein